MKTFDLNLLKEQCGEDKLFYNDMLKIFIKSTREGIEEIEKAIGSNDMEAIGHQAHKILSPCRHINAANMVSMLARLEAIAKGKENKTEDLPELLEKIKAEFKLLSVDITKEIV